MHKLAQNSQLHAHQQLQDQCLQLYKKVVATQHIIKEFNIIRNDKNQSKFRTIQKNQQQLKLRLNSISSQSQSKQSASDLQQNQKTKKMVQILLNDSQLQEKGFQIQQLFQLHSKLKIKQKQMLVFQSQYKQLMKQRYKFIRSNKIQQTFNKMVKDKLLRNIENISNQMREIYEMGTRSSISSTSFDHKYAVEDWINQEKVQKCLKEKQKLLEEIKILEKQLEEI